MFPSKVASEHAHVHADTAQHFIQKNHTHNMPPKITILFRIACVVHELVANWYAPLDSQCMWSYVTCASPESGEFRIGNLSNALLHTIMPENL